MGTNFPGQDILDLYGDTDRCHLSVWAKSSGYTIRDQQVVVRCVCCDYSAIADTRERALAAYEEHHVKPIKDRNA